MEENKELEDLKNYLGLSDIEETEKAKWILDELNNNYGDWGKKVAVYFSSILSGTKGNSSSILPSSMVESYKELFNTNYDVGKVS